MIRLKALAMRSARVFLRVFPPCSMLSQAIAYNLFLAFFPTLLLIVALATSRWGSQTNLLDMVTDFTKYLPPGSRQIVSEFLIKRAPQAWKWAVVGWVGTLVAGSQVMKLIMEGIHIIYHDAEKPGFWLRHWVARELGETHPFHGWWPLFFPVAAFLLSLAALIAIYRVARPQETSLRNVVPGAVVATLLWWLADVVFGFYVRRVPYSVVYGGLAAVIGLLIWMQISAIIIFVGAAWNAENYALRNARS